MAELSLFEPVKQSH